MNTYYISEVSEFIRTLGRSIYKSNSLLFDWSCTGIEFNVHCDGDVFLSYGWSGRTGKFAVIINDNEEDIRQIKASPCDKETVCIATGLVNGIYKIKILKLSEASMAGMEIFSLSFQGAFLKKPNDKSVKLEFYGDSITCGAWNELYQHEHPDMIDGDYEDGYNSYASITGRKLDADFNLIAISGWGIAYGYCGKEGLIPRVYDRALKSDAGTKWDFSKYCPDMVVINLSTNDSSWESEARAADFGGKTLHFLREIRLKYPQAHILWANGLMGKGKFETDIIEAISLCNDEKMYYFGGLPINQDGGDWHPTIHGHHAAAEVLATKIKQILWKS